MAKAQVKGEKDLDDDLGLEPQAFESLERDFQEVLRELAGDQSLERFRLEYEKLHRALKASHENEKRLIRKCKELNGDIVSNAARVQNALKLTQEDSHTIAFLRTEIDKAYRIIEQSRQREETNKQKIENLHEEIKHLQSLIDQGNNISSGQNNTVNELLSAKETLTKEKENLYANLANTKAELSQALDKIKNLEEDKLNSDNEMKSLNKQLKETLERVQKDEERKNKIQSELDQIKRNYEASKKISEDQQVANLALQEKITELEKKNLEKDKEKDKMYGQLNALEDIRENLEKNLNAARHHINELNRKCFDSEKTNKALHAEINEQKSKINTMVRERNKLSKEMEALKAEKTEAEKTKDIALNSVHQLEREIEDTKRLANEDRKVIQELAEARNLMNKEINKAEENNKKYLDKLNSEQKNSKEKQNDIQNLKKEIERMNKKINQLEKEKEKYGMNVAQANAKYFHSLEEIKLKDNLISEFQKKNIEMESKLKQQQNLYEAVRSDRNLYSKNLTETQDEIAEIKRRYKIVSHQISQLKEEIDAKEAALTEEHFAFKQADTRIAELQKDNDKYKHELEEKEKKIKNFINEIGKLQFIIKESEQQRKKLKDEYEVVVSERDILGTQLIRRNDELALLYEKIKIQQSTLAKGEAQYRERLNDIELLKNKIADLYRELKIYRKQAESIPDLKNEIHNLQKELVDEKLRVKGLSEELENPMNVHRWRKLEGTDSDTYEMITKIQTLQKRLISKTEECVEKDVVIQQKQKILDELREIMKRQPGIEEAKMISTYQQNIKQKTRQMKAMAAELNMYQAQVNEYKYEIERLTRELQEIKRKYFEIKKREQLIRDAAEKEKGIAMQINLPDKRYTGGGFNLAV